MTSDKPWLRFYEPGVPHTLEYPPITVPEFLDQSAARFPRHVAAVFFGAQLTYAQLNALANRFAFGLVRLGVRPGDRVSLHLPNCPQFLIAYYGVLKAGAVVVPIYPSSLADQIEYIVRDSGSVLVIADSGEVRLRVRGTRSNNQSFIGRGDFVRFTVESAGSNISRSLQRNDLLFATLFSTNDPIYGLFRIR